MTDESDAPLGTVVTESDDVACSSLSSRLGFAMSLLIPTELPDKWADGSGSPSSECSPAVRLSGRLPSVEKDPKQRSRVSSSIVTPEVELESQKSSLLPMNMTPSSGCRRRKSSKYDSNINQRKASQACPPGSPVLLPELKDKSNAVFRRKSSANLNGRRSSHLTSVRTKFQTSEEQADLFIKMRFLSRVKTQSMKVQEEEPEPTEEEKAAQQVIKAQEHLAMEKKKRRTVLLRAIAQAGMFAAAVGGGKKNKKASLKKSAPFWFKASIKETKETKAPTMVLPTASDLCDLPQDLKQTFNVMAMEALRKYLYPKLLIWKHRMDSQRKLAVVDNPPKMTVEILQRQSMFQQWPVSLLKEVIDRLMLASYDKNDFIIHEDERSGSGIYFVMTGKVVVLKKKDRCCKAIGGANAHVLVTLNPIICVGEFSFLTEEPRMASIRALCRVDCLVLKKEDFAYFVKQLSPGVFKSVIEVAFATRNSNMHLSYPLTEAVIRQCPIFEPCPSDMLEELIISSTPYCVPKDFRICNADDPALKLFFLRNGKCGVVRSIRNAYGRRSSDTIVQTLRSPCVIGDSAVIHTGPYGDSVVTLSTCDFWVLPKDAFDKSLRRYRSVESLVMSEARNQRQQQLAHQQNLFRGCIYNIPFILSMCSKDQQRELVWSFQAHVYKPLSVICSTTQFADRLIILYKGTCKVGEREFWRQGECIGFSCIVPHKWSCKVVASGVVECLELPLFLFDEFLTRHNLKKRLLRHIKRLLFPYAFPVSDVKRSHSFVTSLKSPVMYPVSQSSKVNLTEEGFSPKHYSHLDNLNKGKLPVESVPANCSKKSDSNTCRKEWIRHGTQLWMRKVDNHHLNEIPSDPLIALRSVGKVARKKKKVEEVATEEKKVSEPWRAFLT